MIGISRLIETFLGVLEVNASPVEDRQLQQLREERG